MIRTAIKITSLAMVCAMAVVFLFAGCLTMLSNPGPSVCGSDTTLALPSGITLKIGPAATNFFNVYPADVQKEQKAIAGMIITIGLARKLDTHDIQIALGAAIQESRLQNLNYGDRDSVNMFQMRPSIIEADGTHYWGTSEQLMDPIYSINRFYTELEKFKGRHGMSVKDVAVLVEKPNLPYPDWKWDDIINELTSNIDAITPGTSTSTASAVADTCTGTEVVIGSAVKGDDYPYSGGPIDVASSFGYYTRECVDFVAWRLNAQAGVTKPPFRFSGYGNAATWKDRLVAQGYVANNLPAVGAVAWWTPGTGGSGELGHVAIVSAVHDNGSITVEEYNVLPMAAYSYFKMDMPLSSLANIVFIHVADIKQPTPISTSPAK